MNERDTGKASGKATTHAGRQPGEARLRPLQVHHEGRYLGLYEVDGWEYVTRTNASGVVAIVAVTAAGELLLVEQHRNPVDAAVIELPAGLAGDQGERDEPLLRAAQRELWEETGYRSERWRFLTLCPSSAGMSDEMLTIFLAEACRRVGPGGGDSSEDIAVHPVDLGTIDQWLGQAQRDGKLLDPKIYSALYWLARRDTLDVLFSDASPDTESDPETHTDSDAAESLADDG